VKGIEVCSNEGPCPLQRGDNHKNVKNGVGLKIFSRTIEPILTRLGTNHPLVKGIQVCSNEGDSPSTRGDNSRRVKIHGIFLEKNILQDQQAKFKQTWYKLSLGEFKFVQIKSQVPFKGGIITKM
jgi:hypothetical protein